jgi:hypothetical protein
VVSVLRLEVLDYAGPASWRWRLSDAGGAFLADHEVRLDPSAWEFGAFSDLDRFLVWRVAPDRRLTDEAELVTAVGRWIGTAVLGQVGVALAERAPVTVRVDVPAGEAGLVAHRPLELAWVQGRPLALRQVSLVLAPLVRCLVHAGRDGEQPAEVVDRRESLAPSIRPGRLAERRHAQGRGADRVIGEYVLA